MLGLVTAVAGGLASAMAVLVIMPGVSPAGHNNHASKFGTSIVHQVAMLLTPDIKIVTLVLLLAPTVFLAVRSPIILLAVPTVAWRFLATDPSYWGTGYHYGLVLMPILFGAFIDVLRRRPPGIRWILAASVAVTALFITQNGFAPAFTTAFWQTSASTSATRALLARIPAGTSVAASNQLVPQLTAGHDVTLIGRTPLAVSRPEYIVSETGNVGFPLGAAGQAQWLDDARAHGYTDIGTAGSVVLLQRN